MFLQIGQMINNQFQCSGCRPLQLVRCHTRNCRAFARLITNPKERIIPIILTLRSQTALIFQVTPPTIRIFRSQTLTTRLENRAIMHLHFVHFKFRHGIQMFLGFVKMHVGIYGRTFVNGNVRVLDCGSLRFNDNFFQVTTFCADKDDSEAACCGRSDCC